MIGTYPILSPDRAHAIPAGSSRYTGGDANGFGTTWFGRYTGVLLVYKIGAIFSVSLTPLVATALLHANGDRLWLIAAYVAAAGVISAICASAMKRVP